MKTTSLKITHSRMPFLASITAAGAILLVSIAAVVANCGFTVTTDYSPEVNLANCPSCSTHNYSGGWQKCISGSPTSYCSENHGSSLRRSSSPVSVYVRQGTCITGADGQLTCFVPTGTAGVHVQGHPREPLTGTCNS
jgi:hypothetical protein